MRNFVKYAAFIVLIFCFEGCFCKKKSEWLISIGNSSRKEVELEVLEVKDGMKKSFAEDHLMEEEAAIFPLQILYGPSGKYILVLEDKKLKIKIFLPEEYQEKAPITIRFLKKSVDK